ncbi:MAG: dTDP-4-dehydrorhamnose 3,5-epimerase family protein [Solirubrobacterales bacterium]|nr:dTDP-4-dehydrorhamnose 3,5-epimerase family protein [Solirubrobacterales bacterium]
MRFVALKLADARLIELERHADERGYLARVFCEDEFAEAGLTTRFVQASTVHTDRAGTLRGLHYQLPPHAEVKLVRCTAGAAHVVIVDLRPDSPSYLQWLGMALTPTSGRMLYVPEGYAQGYQTLADGTEMLYQMSTAYEPSAARGVRYNDPAFGIRWPPARERLISDRDRAWPDYQPIAAAQPLTGVVVATPAID